MSKTFGEIKKGDKVYYYSHGKIHIRVVTDVCDCKTKWSDRLRPCIVFKRGCPIDIESDWVRRSHQYGEYFSCIEELVKAMKRRADYAKYQLKKYYNACNKWHKITSDYADALDEFYNENN